MIVMLINNLQVWRFVKNKKTGVAPGFFVLDHALWISWTQWIGLHAHFVHKSNILFSEAGLEELAASYSPGSWDTVPSAMRLFTTEFGMGSGVSSSLWPPAHPSPRKLTKMFTTITVMTSIPIDMFVLIWCGLTTARDSTHVNTRTDSSLSNY